MYGPNRINNGLCLRLYSQLCSWITFSEPISDLSRWIRQLIRVDKSMKAVNLTQLTDLVYKEGSFFLDIQQLFSCFVLCMKYMSVLYIIFKCQLMCLIFSIFFLALVVNLSTRFAVFVQLIFIELPSCSFIHNLCGSGDLFDHFMITFVFEQNCCFWWTWLKGSCFWHFWPFS